MLLLHRSKALHCLIGLVLIGCGQHKVILIDPAIQPYYDRFLSEARRQSVDLAKGNLITSIVPNLNPLEEGRCTFGEIPTVTVSNAYWASASDADREQLIFHELGHCVLGRVHLDGALSSGIPVSIMNTFHFNQDIYLNNHDYYMRELFFGPFL